MTPSSPTDSAAAPGGSASSSAGLAPAAARRRDLRQQRRAERLRNLWRLLVFSGLSAGLGLVLLRQGWTLAAPGQVEVVGSRIVSHAQVIQAGQLRFPLSLLELSPRELSGQLAAALPVEQVRVSRWMLPPRLRIELLDRQAIARAERRTPQGPEPGLIDRLGNWIQIPPANGIRLRPLEPLLVRGWQARHRPALQLVLANRAAIGSGLQEIRFEVDGSLWLTTAQLGPIRLGPMDSRLARRLEVVAHLNRALPRQIGGRRPTQIDLSDPEQPELSLAGPVTSAEAGRSAPAGRPPGGQ